MCIEEKEYRKPQFELVIVETIDIMNISIGDNNVGHDQLFGNDFGNA